MRFWGASALFLVAVSCEESIQPQKAPADGSVQGIVRLPEGVELEPTHITNTTDPEICGQGQTLEDVLVSDTRGLKNVIVSVHGVPAPTPAPAPENLTLDNLECRFHPHAAAITTGSTIEAKNSDTVLHTTHLYGPTEINFSLPIQGAKGSRTLDEPGMYVVKCDVHGWMQAFIRVDPHPFHAVTDSDGRFRIEGLPPGNYTLELWHEKFGTLERDVRIDDTASTTIEIEYSP